MDEVSIFYWENGICEFCKKFASGCICDTDVDICETCGGYMIGGSECTNPHLNMRK